MKLTFKEENFVWAHAFIGYSPCLNTPLFEFMVRAHGRSKILTSCPGRKKDRGKYQGLRDPFMSMLPIM